MRVLDKETGRDSGEAGEEHREKLKEILNLKLKYQQVADSCSFS